MDDNWTLDTPDPPPLAVAKRMYEQLDILDDYHGDFGEDWWKKFKRFDLPAIVEHWIDKEKLVEEAERAGYQSEKLEMLKEWLEHGVPLGCEKESARMPTECDNMESAFEHGIMLTDTIQGWCDLGICAGPYTKQELEKMGFKNIKLTPMQVRVKPNGKVRGVIIALNELCRICVAPHHPGLVSTSPAGVGGGAGHARVSEQWD